MTERARLMLWLALLGVVVLIGGWQWQRGVSVDSDILALLPEAPPDNLEQRAMARSAQTAEGMVVWLAGGANRSDAIGGAEWLEQALAGVAELTIARPEAALAAEVLKEHRHGLLSAADRELLGDDPEAWLAAKREALYGPGGWQRAVALADDPLYLHGDYLLDLLPDGDYEGGHATRCQADRCYAIVVTQLAGGRFAVADQRRLLQRVMMLRAAADERDVELLVSGLPLFIAEASVQAQREISTVGLGSIIAIMLLLLASFRRPRPLLLALIALAVGTAAATVACMLIFGRIHLLALVFGASLVGVAIDYVLHWLCNRFEGGVAEPLAEADLLRALGLALLTSIVGFGLLILTPFPGLRQIAVFFLVGLIGAWLTVALAFPWLGRGMRLQWRAPLEWPDWVASRWSRLGRRYWTWVVAAACLLFAGVARLEPSDDLRLLQSVPERQLAAHSRVQELAPLARDSQFLLVRGPDSEAVLAAEAELLQGLSRLQRAVGRAHAVGDAFPAVVAQRRVQRNLLQLCESGRLATWLRDLGAQPDLAAVECARIAAARPLSLDAWAAAVGEPWQGLWLGCEASDRAAPLGREADACASMVALTGVRDLAALQALASRIEGVELVDPVARISSVLGHQRELASRWLLAALALIAPLLMWRLGLAKGCMAALVPAFTVFSVLATLGWLGASFSLFNLLALLVVGGISVDYAVFNAVGGRHPATALAMVLAGCTTLLAFGLLALSETPLVAAFGLTLALGIGYAVLWAPLLLRRDDSVSADNDPAPAGDGNSPSAR